VRKTLATVAIALLTCVLVPGLKAEQTPHAPAPATLDSAFAAMYDLNFAQANDEIARYEAAHPNDALGPVAEAASLLFSMFEKHRILQAEFFTSDNQYERRKPVTPDGAQVQRFEAALERAEALATRILARDAGNRNALFSMALVHGLRADYAALIERRDFAALRYSGRATEWANKLLALSPDYYDAYVATGIQKYLVGQRSAPVRWVLRIGGVKGDVDGGMRELALAADKGHYLAPFARILLAIAHLRKGERSQAVTLLAQLREQYPHNPLFAEEVARLRDNR
jgi:tetratricopeptide (TPR) repeat protein